jgi:hypothetical protein
MFKTTLTAIFLAITLALQVAGLPKPVTGDSRKPDRFFLLKYLNLTLPLPAKLSALALITETLHILYIHLKLIQFHFQLLVFYKHNWISHSNIKRQEGAIPRPASRRDNT